MDEPPPDRRADILVAGSVALDLSCDYVKWGSKEKMQLRTSNPACIRQAVGGVGHNVALAAHLVSVETTVRLCSLVGDDE
jgi:pseudouridine-5'-phosphate glycosidase/pseudouridine kinase